MVHAPLNALIGCAARDEERWLRIKGATIAVADSLA
jgi:hypothetical protein